jgi:hypothetical protein
MSRDSFRLLDPNAPKQALMIANVSSLWVANLCFMIFPVLGKAQSFIVISRLVQLLELSPIFSHQSPRRQYFLSDIAGCGAYLKKKLTANTRFDSVSVGFAGWWTINLGLVYSQPIEVQG